VTRCRFPALGHGQRVVAELICCAASHQQINWSLTNSLTLCQCRHGLLHWLLVCGDLLELHWMTTMLHPSLSLRYKGSSVVVGWCCLLLILCHHYVVTDRITRMGEGMWVGQSGGWCVTIAAVEGHWGPRESAHLSIHLHVPESLMATEDSLSQRVRTQLHALTSTHQI